MQVTLELLTGVLRMEIRQRETADETRQLIEALFAEREKHGVLSVLVVTRASRPIFKVEEYGLSSVISRVAAIPGLRLAAVAEDAAQRAAHDYVTLLATQRGAPMRNFASEEEALAWLREPR